MSTSSSTPQNGVGNHADLTPQQLVAVQASDPVLVLAGAGTGKTKTLTAGVAHRITARRMHPSRILAVTFTNRAAAEMLTRIRTALGDGSAPGWDAARFHHRHDTRGTSPAPHNNR